MVYEIGLFVPHYLMKYFVIFLIGIAILPLLVQSVHSLELDTSSYSLKQQIKEGWDIESLFCHNDQVLILKITDESPACVNPETAVKLVDRGWGIMPATITPIEVNSKNIIEANNQFALDFYSKVSSDDEKNIFFSPTSISIAFAIAYEGARGNTADEINQAFGFPKNDEERRNAYFAMIEQLNEKDAKYKLRIANALWLAEGFEPFQEYVNTAKTYYDSEVSTVNFLTDGIDIINDWVKTKTEEKIKQLFPPGSGDSSTRMAITNAIYFKGTWVEQFDEEQTKMDDFRVNQQTVVKVPMMELKTTFLNYTRNDQLEILELPYEGDKLSMLILLPTSVDGIKSLEESLTTDNLNQWAGKLRKAKTKVFMPKFTLETEYGLIPVLKELGIHDAFGNADFSGISESDLFIEKAIHKAFVDVNEEGTEAAAATGIIMAESAPVPFRADHPFIFIIQDKETGNILFIGKIVDPTA